VLLASTAYWHHLLSIAPTPTNQIAIGVFIVSWIAQFIGHGAFEGRAPALLDNLVQALVLAPFFVWMEALFKLGYRPELRARVDKEVEKEVEKYRRSVANGAVKNGTAK
jgi:2-hydroxy fatty acid dioxygenase